MPASDALNTTLFHGTTNPNWPKAEWVHLGTEEAASRRLHAVTDPYSFEFSDDHPSNPMMYAVRLKGGTRVAPMVEAVNDPENGMWQDLGHRLTEGTWNPSEDFDAYPYENVDEGGTSYYVRSSSIGAVKRHK